jgi:alkaline phosphatase
LLQDELNKQRYNTAAKNIIFFLGDGMSIPTITASRIFKGQKDGNPGEETDMTFDKFPYAALSRVSTILNCLSFISEQN